MNVNGHQSFLTSALVSILSSLNNGFVVNVNFCNCHIENREKLKGEKISQC